MSFNDVGPLQILLVSFREILGQGMSPFPGYSRVCYSYQVCNSFLDCGSEHRSIWEMVTFLDLGFHKTKQEEFDGDIKDRPMSLKDIKKLV